MVIIKKSRWPKELRLLINKDCNYSCSFPKTCVRWCHQDGVHFFNKRDTEATVEDFLFLAETLETPLKIEKVKIAGMEPLLFPKVDKLIKNLKDAGFPEVSLTTNGFFLEERAEELKSAGLDTLTVSLHAFNRKTYKEITTVDGFKKVISGIEKAIAVGIKKVKANRVLINFDDAWNDLQKFLRWAAKNKITVKLYRLIWSKEEEEKLFFQNYFSWHSLLAFLAKRGKLRMIKKYSASGRERLFWTLKNGLEIETDIFSHKLQEGIPVLCRRCRFAAVCQEGIVSYGLEVNSELIISACLLREELSLDVWDLVKKRDAKKLIKEVKIFLSKFGS
ncbi:MAG: GTP 3',8-cyclase MoaA [bacterium]|nr:GTP 3',8-cyclase MoaA [bacterium]